MGELKREITALRSIARDYLAPGADSVLRQAESALDAIAVSRGSAVRWQVSASNPILTQQSQGEYMPAAEGELHVYAAVTFIWELLPLHPSGVVGRPATDVELVGLASTLVRVMEGNPGAHLDGHEIARWRMEVGDARAPGTHFHVQVLGNDELGPFPKSLDIPRLPGIIISPLACVEYVIAELFQDRWPATASRDTGAMGVWSGIQRTRLQRQLSWHGTQLDRAASSPWVAIKTGKPPVDLFL
ncbi:hypothetical protein [Microbacterium sp. NPDC056569]|uniref:hypothetical protein n=1 Tax=Microbacterium sp. NPDC056569 TaxID=3345867 RepID=UPI00367336C3